MKIAILGTRGIPNHYGGFEQVTEYLSSGLCSRGHEVTVYSSHNHPYPHHEWKGVRIIHCYDPEYLLGTAGQFIYDLNCILDARRQNFDVILFMGYTSSSVWHFLFPRDAVIISNMDGLEWKRTKYSRPVQQFLKYAEKLAVRHSHFHIVDAVNICNYLDKKYGIHCNYIPYGASLRHREKKEILMRFGLLPKNYFLLMARMEPENNIDTILQGFQKSRSEKQFLVIGNIATPYGRTITRRYADDKRIIFAGSIFDQDLVHTLRKNAILYFHGHSVGGTNPSLLEAMASRSHIAAQDNCFNKDILQQDAHYFTTAADVKKLIEDPVDVRADKWKENNYRKIQEQFDWEKVIDQYEEFICNSYGKRKSKSLRENRAYVYD